MIKNVSLVFSLFVVALSVCGVVSLGSRFSDIFVHGNIFHCLANVWALLYVCFLLKTDVTELLLSVIIGASLLYLGWPYHIVGLSGCLYALYAIISYRVRNKKRYHLVMSCFILLSMLIPQFAGMYHLVCYITGVFVGYPIYKIKQYVRRRKDIRRK